MLVKSRGENKVNLNGRIRKKFIAFFIMLVMFAQTVMNMNTQSFAAGTNSVQINIKNSEGELVNNAEIELVKLPDISLDSNNVVHIRNKADLEKYINIINNGNDYGSRILYLDADIDLQETAKTDWTINKNFAGYFDGQGHTISGLNSYGLFKTLTSSAIVKDLNIASQTINCTSSSEKIGSIASINSGTIQNCTVESNITSTGTVGGIVHTNQGKILNCIFKGSATGKEVAGIVYDDNAILKDSHNEATLTFN